jgi:hypothetical protein
VCEFDHEMAAVMAAIASGSQACPIDGRESRLGPAITFADVGVQAWIGIGVVEGSYIAMSDCLLVDK